MQESLLHEVVVVPAEPTAAPLHPGAALLSSIRLQRVRNINKTSYNICVVNRMEASDTPDLKNSAAIAAATAGQRCDVVKLLHMRPKKTRHVHHRTTPYTRLDGNSL